MWPEFRLSLSLFSFYYFVSVAAFNCICEYEYSENFDLCICTNNSTFIQHNIHGKTLNVYDVNNLQFVYWVTIVFFFASFYDYFFFSQIFSSFLHEHIYKYVTNKLYSVCCMVYAENSTRMPTMHSMCIIWPIHTRLYRISFIHCSIH